MEVEGEVLFEIYSTGMALGYVKSNTIKGKTYYQCRKDRVDKCIENAEISTLVHDGLILMNESQLYDFMLEARTDKCKAFRKWVTTEVLPRINSVGGFVAEGREEDFINNHFESFSDEVKLGMINDLMKKNKQYKEQVDKYKQFMDLDGTFGFRNLVKHLNGLGFNVKETDVRRKLIDENIICKEGKKYVVSQQGVRDGYGVMQDCVVGYTNRPKTKYTEKLRDHLIDIFKENKAI